MFDTSAASIGDKLRFPQTCVLTTACRAKQIQDDGIRLAFMKFVIVIQRVKVPSSQSLANRLVVNPAGQSGNGSPKPGGAREQAA